MHYLPQQLLGDGLQNSTTWIQFPLRAQVALCATCWRPTLGPLNPHIQCKREGPCEGLNCPGDEGDHSIQSSAETKNAWSLYLSRSEASSSTS